MAELPVSYMKAVWDASGYWGPIPWPRSWRREPTAAGSGAGSSPTDCCRTSRAMTRGRSR
jgi:hypothetical protein